MAKPLAPGLVYSDPNEKRAKSTTGTARSGHRAATCTACRAQEAAHRAVGGRGGSFHDWLGRRCAEVGQRPPR